MSQVVWTPVAESDLDDVLLYIAIADRRPATAVSGFLIYLESAGLAGRRTLEPFDNLVSQRVLRPQAKVIITLRVMKRRLAGETAMVMPHHRDWHGCF